MVADVPISPRTIIHAACATEGKSVRWITQDVAKSSSVPGTCSHAATATTASQTEARRLAVWRMERNLYVYMRMNVTLCMSVCLSDCVWVCVVSVCL